MKNKIKQVVWLATLTTASLSWAADMAPVEDINQTTAQQASIPAANPSEQMPADQSASNQQPSSRNLSISLPNTDNTANQGANAQNPAANQAFDAAAAAMSQPATNLPATTMPMADNLTPAQQLQQMQQQLNNLISMNMPQQISELQQQIAELKGQLQVQQHDLQMLNNRQRSFYQDLDQRIRQMKNLAGDHTNSLSNTASSMNDNANTNATTAKDNAANANANANANPTNHDTTNATGLDEASAYQNAFNWVAKRQYAQAQQALQAYLQKYPKGKYVANAHYWLGEIYMQQKDAKKALAEFSVVIKNYPKSNKVPDAKLKQAIIQANMGHIAEAKRELQAIKQQHPNSTAAQLANIRLQQLMMNDSE